MDAPTARGLQRIDLGLEVLPLGPGDAGIADQDRSRCVIQLLFCCV
jgi:hypothetical protein